MYKVTKHCFKLLRRATNTARIKLVEHHTKQNDVFVIPLTLQISPIFAP